MQHHFPCTILLHRIQLFCPNILSTRYRYNRYGFLYNIQIPKICQHPFCFPDIYRLLCSSTLLKSFQLPHIHRFFTRVYIHLNLLYHHSFQKKIFQTILQHCISAHQKMNTTNYAHTCFRNACTTNRKT